MESITLRDLVSNSCPLRLTLNNGGTFDIERPEFVMVSDYEVTVMVNRHGGMRNVTISLVNVASAEPLGAAS